jgi:hypothetical protein
MKGYLSQQVQRDEGVLVPGNRASDGECVERDPQADDRSLADDECRRAKEAREALGEDPEVVAAKGAVVV